ncbi:unnamed protein product [Mytilus coruscus]|uniref:G-protein coupled receptors family 2 profile 2 domain-containing protein n=1 Tax=Mytilus coruscus TaxID=42192 RepID=A0A6J8D4J5_MYTCO|nr:unnamed protein product [Mytilus coruscus]
METAIANYLKRYLKLNRDLHFISADLITNSTCIINETVGMEILASIEVFIDEVVSRKDIERKLANISGELVNVTGYDNINLTISLDYNAINTKSKINNIGQFTGLCYLSTTDSDFKRSHMYYKFNLVSNLLFCKQVVLDKSEFIVIFNPTTSVTFVSSKVKIDQGHFRIAGNGTVRICVDTLLSLKEPNVPIDKVMSAIMTTATIISMICLSATFITYCLFPSLRSVPGKNNMSLVFSLFCLQAVYTISTHKIEHLLSCQVIGIIIHYFLLSYFACLSVCTFHMLKALSSTSGPYSTGHGNRTVLVYCLFSYCTPTIIIIVNIVVTFSLADNIGYGVRGYICFVKYSSAVIGTVIIPISFICVCNVAFFVMTMRKISSTPKIQRTSSHKTTHDNSIVYIKLFSITGITWVFPIIDAFLPMTSLTVMFSLLNVLQGVYIFLSYICNTRVRRMYRNLCGCYTDGLDSNFTGLTNSSQVLSASSVKYLSQQNTKCIRESKI